MGKLSCRIIRYLPLALLGIATAGATGEDTISDEPGFSIQSGQNRERTWNMTFPQGQEQKLTPAAKRELLANTIFPQVIADAAGGKEPQVRQVGFFYLDGVGIPQDLEKAEAAFRIGMERGHPGGLYLLGEYFHEKGMTTDAGPEKQQEHFHRADQLYREVLEAGFSSAIRSVVPLAQAHLFGWYGLEENPEQAEANLAEVEKVLPQDP